MLSTSCMRFTQAHSKQSGDKAQLIHSLNSFFPLALAGLAATPKGEEKLHTSLSTESVDSTGSTPPTSFRRGIDSICVTATGLQSQIEKGMKRLQKIESNNNFIQTRSPQHVRTCLPPNVAHKSSQHFPVNHHKTAPLKSNRYRSVQPEVRFF